MSTRSKAGIKWFEVPADGKVMAQPITQVAQCSHCKHDVPPERGMENSRGEVLCEACYVVLWVQTPKGR